jgi:uncharacterized membrane protein YkoI
MIIGCAAIWTAVGEEEEIPLSEVPAKVLEAANNAVPGGEVKGVEMEIEDGVTIYDVEKVVEGVEYEIEVTANGTVKEVEKEGEIEDEEDDYDDDGEKEEDVSLSDVPDVILKSAKEAVPDGKITEVEKEVDDGETIYEVEIVVRYEVLIKPNGDVIKIGREIEEDDDDD